METIINYGLHQFDSRTIQWVKHAVLQPDCTRASLARERPELAAAEVVDDDELLVLDVKLAGHDMKPTDTGTYRNMHGFVVDVGRLAGFRPRHSQPLPGVSKLWEGVKILREATHTYQSLRAQDLIKNE